MCILWAHRNFDRPQFFRGKFESANKSPGSRLGEGRSHALPRARSEAKASKTETAKMTPSARNANKRKAESSPENGGDASTTTAANPSRPQRKKQKQQADESTSPAASPVAGNHGGVSSAPTGMKKHMLSLLNELQTAVDETYPPLASNTRVHLVLM